ncbi:MAG TPA: hypothetical protein VGM82_09195 [Gemmatimonadaceae bacterium]|jgi:hypothetical protein
MAPRVPFLQQLAPAAQRGGAFVRAAVPSRFAPQTSGLEVSSTTVGAEAAESSKARDADDARVAMRPLSRSTNEVSNAVVSRTEREHANEGVTAPLVSTERDANVTMISHERVVERTPIQTQIVISQQSPVSEPIRDLITAEKRPSDEKRADSPIIRTPLASPPNATVRPPLREHVREQRIAAPAEASPTIVQVTIDRIDVRAAATSASTERATQKARSSSWKSLGDYLKQGDRANGGAS